MLQRIRLKLAIFLVCASVAAQQAPFDYETATNATRYMEWILDAAFTADQRQHYQEILAEMWRGSQSSRDSISAMARAFENLARLDETAQARMRSEKQPQFLRLLETATDDKSRWLIEIYRAAHTDSAAPRGSMASPSEPARPLLGRWTDGHISSIQYRERTTGVSAPTNGRTFTYEFKADGTYSFTGLMQSVMYNCTTAIFSNETGSYTVNGDSVSLHPEKNPYRMTNNCAPSSNREAPGKLVARSYRFHVETDSGRSYLELRGADGATQKFGSSR